MLPIYDIIYKTGAIKVGNFMFVSGEKSSIYFDIEHIISHPREFDMVTDLLAAQTRLINPSVIAGAETAGIPFATALSLKTNIPMACVKKEEKKHGIRTQIAGHLSKTDNVLLLDDVIINGASKLNFINEVRNTGAKISNVLVILDYGQGGKEKLAENNINLFSLATANDLIAKLFKNGKIDIEEYNRFLKALER